MITARLATLEIALRTSIRCHWAKPASFSDCRWISLASLALGWTVSTAWWPQRLCWCQLQTLLKQGREALVTDALAPARRDERSEGTRA